MSIIMHIDDDAETLEIFRRYLQDTYEVYSYASGSEGLHMLDSVKPDIILLDIEMPVMNGFATLEHLRSMPQWSEIPVIGVTGHNKKTEVLRFMGRGGSAYLVKPVNKDELRQRIDDILKREIVRRQRKNILVVDDEPEYLYTLKNFLADKYHVIALNSSKLAIDYLRDNTPELMILDYNMPLFNGKATCQIVRQMDNGRDLPILIVTGTDEREVVIECASFKPAGVVHKSKGKQLLLAKISSILGE